MYGIFTYIYPENHPNVGKYTMHGSCGTYLSIYIYTKLNDFLKQETISCDSSADFRWMETNLAEQLVRETQLDWLNPTWLPKHFSCEFFPKTCFFVIIFFLRFLDNSDELITVVNRAWIQIHNETRLTTRVKWANVLMG